MRYKGPLRIDKFIPQFRLAFEPDGIQHFITKHRQTLEELRDVIKDAYCVNNGISLVRIPYNTKPTVEMVKWAIEMCLSGKQIYVSYSHYMIRAKDISDMSKICYFEVPSPYSTGKLKNPFESQ